MPGLFFLAAIAAPALLARHSLAAPTYPDKYSNPTATVGRGTTPNASETHVPGPVVYKPYKQTTKGFYNIAQPASINQQKSPDYAVTSRFDYQSINLALNQEWIELDLFHHGLAQFSTQEFEDAGLGAEQRFLLEFMADQEVAHSTVLSNILGPNAAKQCTYRYPYTTVRGFIDFCQKLTRWGESGVYGFLSELENAAAGQLLLQSIATEARQQLIFRQFEGLFPVPDYVIAGVPQAWAWTLLSPYLVSCPSSNPYIEFDIFPTLNITNNPDPLTPFYPSAVSTNRTSLSLPGRKVSFKWDKPGKTTGPDGLYKTISHSKTGKPKYAAWVSMYNATFSALENVTSNTADTIQPSAELFPGQVSYNAINSTLFIALVDEKIDLTPANLTLINPHIVAGPAMYQAD